MIRQQGFSIPELLMAMAITLSIGLVALQLFQQNERIFRDQNLAFEAQQSARLVAAQIAEELRMAGQGVPVYAAASDTSPAEDTAIFLSGTTTGAVQFRADLSNAEAHVTSPMPLKLTPGVSTTLAVSGASAFSNTLWTASPSGAYVYIWGQAANGWAWVRAQLTGISASANTLTITPSQAGEAGRWAGADGVLNTGDDVIQFNKPPFVTLEEAIRFYLESNSIRRATATAMTNQTSPAWSAGHEIGRNFTSLEFRYYDEDGNLINPDSLANRRRIWRIDITVVAQTEKLTGGSRQSYALTTRVVPRNAQLR